MNKNSAVRGLVGMGLALAVAIGGAQAAEKQRSAPLPNSRVQLAPAAGTGASPLPKAPGMASRSIETAPAASGRAAGPALEAPPSLPEAAIENFGGREAAIRAQEARQLGEIKELGGLRGQQGIQEHGLLTPGGMDLGGGRRGRWDRATDARDNAPDDQGVPTHEGMPPQPALPSNRSKTSSMVVGMPSMNLRDHLAGSAGQDSSGSRVIGRRSETTTNRETGTVTRTEQTLHEDGNRRTEQFMQHRDGSSSYRIANEPLDGESTDVRVHKDTEGNVDKVDLSDLATTHDLETINRGGGGCNPVTGQCTGAPMRDPNLVNPGDPERANQPPPAQRLAFDRDDLVTNPSPEASASGGGMPMLRRPQGPTHVNPPGPIID